MTVARFEGKTPAIGAGTYIHPSADVFGDVVIGRAPGSAPAPHPRRLRRDPDRRRDERRGQLRDHARPGEVCTIGNWVTIGHGAIIHNALRIDDYVVIGMGAVVSDWTVLGTWAVVARARSSASAGDPAGQIASAFPRASSRGRGRDLQGRVASLQADVRRSRAPLPGGLAADRSGRHLLTGVPSLPPRRHQVVASPPVPDPVRHPDTRRPST